MSGKILAAELLHADMTFAAESIPRQTDGDALNPVPPQVAGNETRASRPPKSAVAD